MSTEIAKILSGETPQQLEVNDDARRFRRCNNVIWNFLVLRQNETTLLFPKV